jgi:hypothetical protein
MNTTRFSLTHVPGAAVLVTAAATIAVAAAPLAGAEPSFPTAGAESATATISDLQAQGFTVMVNYIQGYPNVPLSECRVNAINDPSAPTASPSTVTVYVDVLCPNAK